MQQLIIEPWRRSLGPWYRKKNSENKNSEIFKKLQS